MNVLRSALLVSTLGAALAARANFINFDDASGPVGNRYLVSDGVSFTNGSALSTSPPSSPSSPNALYHDDVTLTINSPVNVLVGSVGFMYASTSTLTGGTPTLYVYSDLNGAGTLLASTTLADTGSSTAYQPASLAFSGNAKSFVFTDSSYSRITYDNLSFTSQLAPTPEPASLAALGLGAVATLRRRRKA